MTKWAVRLIDEAKADFKRLDGREKAFVAKKLMALEVDPHIGKPLGNKMGMDLTGYFKLYLENRRLRIVYRIEREIIEVVAIGKREGMEVYKLAEKRIRELKEG